MEARLRKRSAPVTALELQRLALVHSRERSPQCAQCCTGEEGELEGEPSGREASAQECCICMLYTVTEHQIVLHTVTEQLTLYTVTEELTLYNTAEELILYSIDEQLTLHTTSEQLALYTATEQLTLYTATEHLTLYTTGESGHCTALMISDTMNYF